MTCIIGLVEGAKAWIGADSATAGGWDGWDVRVTGLPKVFRNGEFVIGYTDSFRMGQILQHHLRVAPQDDECDDMEYMVRVFIESVRSCLKEHGFAKVEDNVEEAGRFLVAYKGKVYYIGIDFQVNCFQDGMSACGCGADYALGALKALSNWPPRKRILLALEITSHFSGGVVKPFTILESEAGR